MFTAVADKGANSITESARGNNGLLFISANRCKKYTVQLA
jgi:hypothetical protein